MRRSNEQKVFVAKGLNVSCSVIDSLAYIILEDKKEVFNFDEVGTFIWRQIDGVSQVEAIVSKCQLEFDGDFEQISECVTDFLVMLNEESLITFSEAVFEGGLCDGE